MRAHPTYLLMLALSACGPAIARMHEQAATPGLAADERAASCPELVERRATAGDTLFEQALAAYARGDDCAALQSLRALEADPDAFYFAPEHPRAYLATITRLSQELARRVARGPSIARAPNDDSPVSTEAIREWILALEDVAVALSHDPRDPAIIADPTVRALVRAGDSAVPALIEVLERDTRVSRTVVPRPFGGPPALLSVARIAHVALLTILHVDLAGRVVVSRERGEGGWWQQLAAAYRSYWAVMEPETPAHRRYLVLADDLARSRAWAAASEGPLEGEDAYGLLLRRASETLADHVHDACTIADAAWRLEPRAAPPMVAFARDCLARRSCPCSSRLVDTLAPEEPSILEALETYRPRAEIGHDLALLVRHRAHPAAQRLLARLFAPQGAYGETWREGPGELAWASVLGVLELEPVRAMLRRALQDQTPFGVLATRGGEAWLSYGSHGHAVTVAALPAVPRDVRRCDAYASTLSSQLGVAHDLSWPTAQRDGAIARMLAALAR